MFSVEDKIKKTNMIFTNMVIVERMKIFRENEARSCSMDFGCIPPEYMFRSWGGLVPISDIKAAMQ